MVDVPALEAGVLETCEFESHHPHLRDIAAVMFKLSLNKNNMKPALWVSDKKKIHANMDAFPQSERMK